MAAIEITYTIFDGPRGKNIRKGVFLQHVKCHVLSLNEQFLHYITISQPNYTSA